MPSGMDDDEAAQAERAHANSEKAADECQHKVLSQELGKDICARSAE